MRLRRGVAGNPLEGNGDVAPPGLVFLSAMFASFLCCFNSPAALAAGEIRVQKKRVASDAPKDWILGCCFMDFSFVFC